MVFPEGNRKKKTKWKAKINDEEDGKGEKNEEKKKKKAKNKRINSVNKKQFKKKQFDHFPPHLPLPKSSFFFSE